MISFFQFLLLSFDEKKQYLTSNGTFLLNRFKDKGEVELYAVGNFFVEMHLDDEKKAADIVAFKSLDHPGLYTHEINLSQLSIYTSIE
jgi:hypothetical protein